MARGGKKEAKAAAKESNPETEERNRLRKLAYKKNILSETPARVETAALGPSKTVMKHHGKDILRKSQRKNRYLFSFPGLLGPVSGGKIGDLKDLGSKNPILYLDFPQGQMKLFGTIVYPKNRYLTLQFSRGGKNVMCEDYFDNMIVFSEAWWIGRKDENPEEQQLEFPKELNTGNYSDSDFKGGAGAVLDETKGVCKPRMKCTEQQSVKHKLEDDSCDNQRYLDEAMEVAQTPTRHSARTAGKSFKFAEASSGDDIIEKGIGSSEEEEEKVDVKDPISNATSTKTFCKTVVEIGKKDEIKAHHLSMQTDDTVKSEAKDVSNDNQGPLKQATISTLFKKVENKSVKSASSTRVCKRKTEAVVSPASATNRRPKSKQPASDLVEGSSQVEDDDIEEFSSSSQDMDESDEDWAA